MLDKIKKHLGEVVKIKTSPEAIAAGFALGTFLAILPTFGFGILIGLLIILIFKKISKIAMLAAFAVWNPFVLILLAAVSYKIGDILLTDLPVRTFKFEFINQVYVYSRRFLVGNIIVSVASSVTCYFAVLFGARSYQKTEGSVDKVTGACKIIRR